MALADVARLVSTLELQDKFSGTATRATQTLTGMERASVRASSSMGGLSRISSGAGAAMGTFGTRMRQVGGAIGAVAGVGGVLGLGLAFGKTISASRDFDTAMRRIVALTDVTGDEIDGVRDSVLALAGDVGKAPQELADGFYFLASAGFDTKEALEVLNTSAHASAAGLGETQAVAQTLGAVINAYGHENLTAAHASDVLLAAIKDGTAEAADFASVLQYVIPTAAAMGVSLEDTTAAIASMTLGGTDASVAATNLNNVFSALLKPTTSAKDQLKEMGTSAEELREEIKEKGLITTLEDLRKRFGGNEAAMAKVFGNVRSLRGVMGLLGLDADQLNKVFRDTHNATGALGQAFDETEGPGRKMDRALAAIQTTAITLGDTYLPLLADGLATVGQWLSTHQDDVRTFGENAVNLVKGLATIALGVVGAVQTAWGAIPDPLKDLLIKGFVADRTVKFLFGFSPAHLVVSGVESAFARIIGQFAANKLVPQVVTAAAPIPVFVTNPGFGGPGGGTPLSPAVPGGGGFLGSFLKGAAVVFGVAAAAELGNVIGHQFFFDPTVKPAVTFEQTQFDELVESAKGDPERLQRGIDSITEGLNDLPPLAHLLARDQVTELERQRTVLQALLDESRAGTPAGQFSPVNAGGTPGTDVTNVHVNNAGDIIPESAFRRMSDEIKAARKAQIDALKDGDIHQARLLEGHIKAIHELQGTIDQRFHTVIPALGLVNRALSVANRNLDDGNRRQREMAARIDQARREANTGFRENNTQLGIIAAKDPVTKVDVTVPVTTQVSINDVIRNVTHASFSSQVSHEGSLGGFQP